VSRKTFAEGEAVEVVPDSLGRRGSAAPEDWRPATYELAMTGALAGWHRVRINAMETRLVPNRRIRKSGAAGHVLVTADTIGEERIRALLLDTRARRQNAHTRSLVKDCEGALEGSRACLERVADVWNARHGAGATP
jgi:hypothetical protein